ncbi:hypothetical protein DSO57_1036401 [Entomophthora muscae]|uniref:Uncharacterized protein n=1 Tax=Entomophthora muscae TaxID=34485 RepID=A0ACC2S1D0_9FUNG|nr:hypothetical protein DSO57_1036401 [Entomophthora muscae]
MASHNYKALDSDLQELSKLTKTMDEHFSPLFVQVQELSTQIADVPATAAVQQIQIGDALQVSIASRNSRVQKATTLNNLEESCTLIVDAATSFQE